MGGLDNDKGIYVPRLFVDEVFPNALQALKDAIGQAVKDPSHPMHQTLLAFGALPHDDMEQDMAEGFAIATDPFSATGQALDGHNYPVGKRFGEKAAGGVVELDYLAPFTSPDPIFDRNDLIFHDAIDRTFRPDADVPAPEVLFEKTGTGVASQTISSGGNASIAWKITIEEFVGGKYVQGLRFVTNDGTAPILTVRIETDDGGDPSGTLLSDDLEKTDVDPANASDTLLGFPSGAYTDTDTDDQDLWVVLIATTGSFTVDGTATGTLGDVKVFTGTWVDDANIRAFNATVFAGGVVEVTAEEAGPGGNILVDTIDGEETERVTGTAVTNWNDHVAQASNKRVFSGGRARESDRLFIQRVRAERAARGTNNPDGVARAIREEVVGVKDALVVENTSDIGGTQDTAFDGSAFTGAASSTIDGTTPFLAFIWTPDFRSFVQHLALTAASDNSFEGTVSIQVDTAGEPGGLLATGTVKTGYMPGGTSRAVVTLDDGAFVEPGTNYHVQIQRTAGDATFDGAAGSSSRVQKSTDGSTWADDASIEDLNFEAIGGVPNKGGRAVVLGGPTTEIGRVIRALRTTGIVYDGDVAGTFTDDERGTEHTEYFRRPTAVPVVIDVEVTTTQAYPGGDDPVKDALIRYIGGTDSDDEEHVPPFIIGRKIVRHEAIGRLQDDDELPGIDDTIVFRLGRKSGFPTPNDLTASEVVNLAAGQLEYLVIENAASDIRVTRSPA